MATQLKKLQKERAQKQILELANLPGNNICADCKDRKPTRWASVNIGIFLCQNCATIHRKIGTHITKIRSVTIDEWSKEQIEFMQSMGNIKSNAIHNPNELRYPPPPNLEDMERDSEMEQYIRAKYEYRKFMDKSAFVASKLGPSRSASSVTPRSVSSPASTSSQGSSTSQTSSGGSTASPGTGFITSRVPVSLLQQQYPQQVTKPEAPKAAKPVVQPLPADFTQPKKNTVTDPLQHSIWADLSSLSTPSQNSTLPLQYQQPGSIHENGYPVGVTASGTGVNPFSRDQYTGGAPYSPQPPSFTATPAAPIPTAAQQGQPQQFGQFLGSSPSNMMLSQSPSAMNFLQTQTNQSYLSPSPNQSFVPTSVTQQSFLSHSPSQQFMSLPQIQTPQLSGQGQYGGIYQSVGSAPPQAQFGMLTSSSAPSSQFLGLTTMQMQQQQLPQQQQQAFNHQMQQQMQQQQLHQHMQQQQLQQMQQQQQLSQLQLGQGGFANNQQQIGYPGQIYSQNGFASHQWGTM